MIELFLGSMPRVLLRCRGSLYTSGPASTERPQLGHQSGESWGVGGCTSDAMREVE